MANGFLWHISPVMSCARFSFVVARHAHFFFFFVTKNSSDYQTKGKSIADTFFWGRCTGFWTLGFLCALFFVWETDLSGVTPLLSLNSIMCASLCAPPCSFQWNCFAPADLIFSRKTGRQSNGSSAFWCITILSHVPHTVAMHCFV